MAAKAGDKSTGPLCTVVKVGRH